MSFFLFFYRDQGRSASKFLISLGALTSAILFRIFLGSLLFAITPYWAIGIIFILYLTHFIVYKAKGHDWSCVLYSYTSLIFPSGYTKNIGKYRYFGAKIDFTDFFPIFWKIVKEFFS